MGVWSTLSDVGKTVVTYGRRTARLVIHTDWINDEEEPEEPISTLPESESTTPSAPLVHIEEPEQIVEAPKPKPALVDKENQINLSGKPARVVKAKKSATEPAITDLTRKKPSEINIPSGGESTRSIKKKRSKIPSFDHQETEQHDEVITVPEVIKRPRNKPKYRKSITKRVYSLEEALKLEPEEATTPLENVVESILVAPPLSLELSSFHIAMTSTPAKQQTDFIDLTLSPIEQDHVDIDVLINKEDDSNEKKNNGEQPRSNKKKAAKKLTVDQDAVEVTLSAKPSQRKLRQPALSIVMSPPKIELPTQTISSPSNAGLTAAASPSNNKPRRLTVDVLNQPSYDNTIVDDHNITLTEDPKMKQVLNWIEQLEVGHQQPQQFIHQPKSPPAQGAHESLLLSLDDLLKIGGQSEPISLEKFLTKKCLHTASKLGESTFAEVFRAVYEGFPVAVKIIPFGSETLVNGFAQTKMDDVYQEMRITQILSDIAGPPIPSEQEEQEDHRGALRTNFVKAHRLGICSGSYPKKLLEEWDIYDLKKGSENDRPDIFLPDQLYAVLILANGGVDLEHSTLHSSQQAKSIVLQVCLSIASVENKLRFEHRDLHWGNILIAPSQQDQFSYKVGDRVVSVNSHGVRATIIDYTLSRLQHQGELLCVELSDEDYFTGQGDYQYDIYRMMRSETQNDWTGYYPRTNLFWIHYLMDKLTNHMRYDITDHQRSVRRAASKQTNRKISPSERREFRGFQDRVLSYHSMEALVADQFFHDVIDTVATVNPLSAMVAD